MLVVTRFRRSLYAYVFVWLSGVLSALNIYLEPSVGAVIWFVAGLGSLVFCMNRCATEDYGYMEGLSHLAERYSSGLVNITVMFLFPTFALLHFYCVVLSSIGLFAGKSFTVRAWEKATEKNRPLKSQPIANPGPTSG